jgi:hypothetical protein
MAQKVAKGLYTDSRIVIKACQPTHHPPPTHTSGEEGVHERGGGLVHGGVAEKEQRAVAEDLAEAMRVPGKQRAAGGLPSEPGGWGRMTHAWFGSRVGVCPLYV